MRIALTAAVVAWLAALSCWDILERRLPNLLTLPGAAAILLGGALTGRGPAALIGAAALTGVYLLVYLLAPAAMGAGDVKLAIGVGGLTGCFGIEAWFLAALGASVLTALVAVLAVPRGKPTVPHGPSMCLAAACAVGPALLTA